MGAEPYSYFVPYQTDIDAALQKLRNEEFQAGRYNPAVPFPFDDPGDASGAKHGSIDEARQDAAEEGTRSILDLDHVSEESEFLAVSPLPDETLFELYETTRPTREMVEENDSFLENLDRGHGVYVICYRDGNPDAIYFGGYSVD